MNHVGRRLKIALFASVSILSNMGAAITAEGIQDLDRAIEVRKIWDQSPHNAFTDLIRWRGHLYCTFRTGTGHVPGKRGENGKIQVITSDDGLKWVSIAHLGMENIDLRDPKLSVTPDDRLMLLAGGSFYQDDKLLQRKTHVAFLSDPKSRFSQLEPVQLPAGIASRFDWLWRVTWKSGVGFGVIYQNDRQPWDLQLVKTSDGIKYEHVKTFELSDRPNESTIRFTPRGTMLIVVRNEGGSKAGFVLQAEPPYSRFSIAHLAHVLGGPDLILLPNQNWILGTRMTVKNKRLTVLGLLKKDSPTSYKFDVKVRLPSGGDTSYPGMVLDDSRLLVSYYSSHEGKTAIYLATVPLTSLQ